MDTDDTQEDKEAEKVEVDLKTIKKELNKLMDDILKKD